MQTVSIVVTDRQATCLTLAANARNKPSAVNPGYPYTAQDVLMEKVCQVELNFGAKADALDPVAAEANALAAALQTAVNQVYAAQQLAATIAASGSANAATAGQISTTLQGVLDTTTATVAQTAQGSDISTPANPVVTGP